MSWTKAVTIWCDVEGCNEWHDGSGYATIGDTQTAREARSRGKVHGWAFRAGRDLCPDHADVENRGQFDVS